MVKMSGHDKHLRRLRAMRSPALIRGVTQALYGIAGDIIVDAATSITEGAQSGKNHQPSAPGEPPNADSHVLSNSGEAVVISPLKVEASFNAPYAAAQELGSEELNLPERPYFRPAAQKNRPNAQRKVVEAVNKVVGRVR